MAGSQDAIRRTHTRYLGASYIYIVDSLRHEGSSFVAKRKSHHASAHRAEKLALCQCAVPRFAHRRAATAGRENGMLHASRTAVTQV